jgi:glycosidase
MRAILLISLVLIGLSTRAQEVPLTFRVDMSNEEVSENGVHVAGTFQSLAGYPSDWNPGTTELSDTDGDEVYEITVNVPSGTYLYKFINGSSWEDQPENPPLACAVNDGGGNLNRQVTVGENGITLPVVSFDSCNAVINFSVSLADEVISPEGIFVTGDFLEEAGYGDNWATPGLALSDINADGTYQLSVQVPAGDYAYYFLNGSQAEDFTGSCTDDQGYRTLTASEGAPPPPTYCFNSCDVCDPNLTEDYELHWWNDAVFYEIFVRSFYDSNGDGIGDFQGIIEKLDYLNDGDPETTDDLGITGIWLMPTMPSPSYHGYDVTDYYGIESDYGTMADFQEFLDEAHERGIKVILDYVMNHSSSQHPWFNQSQSNQNGFRDWYVWSDTNPGFDGPWGQNVWHGSGGDWYYGLFWGGMPDLNYDHQPVRDEMMEIAQYWIDLGVDGYRLDAVKYLDEDGTVLENTTETFEILEELNDVVTAADEDAILVGEVWSNSQSVSPYVINDRLDICFEFDLAGSILNAVNGSAPGSFYGALSSVQAAYPKLQYATFLTNHDINRVYDQLDNDDEKMKQAAAVYLTLPGVPFIYYGEEVGMQGTGADEIKRRPMQWSDAANGGFTSGSPWISLGGNYVTNNVAAMEADPNSLLEFYKNFIHLRNDLTPLRRGYALPLYGNADSVLHFIRIYENEAVATVINLGEAPAAVEINLPVSTLAEGDYLVTDMLAEALLENIQISSNGGFSGWSPVEVLAPGEIKVLSIGATSPLRISENALPANEVELFPNPADEMVYLKSKGKEFTGQYRIYDQSGRILFSASAQGRTLSIDLNRLSGGVYFIQVETEEATLVKRVVVR